MLQLCVFVCAAQVYFCYACYSWSMPHLNCVCVCVSCMCARVCVPFSVCFYLCFSEEHTVSVGRPVAPSSPGNGDEELPRGITCSLKKLTTTQSVSGTQRWHTFDWLGQKKGNWKCDETVERGSERIERWDDEEVSATLVFPGVVKCGNGK